MRRFCALALGVWGCNLDHVEPIGSGTESVESIGERAQWPGRTSTELSASPQRGGTNAPSSTTPAEVRGGAMAGHPPAELSAGPNESTTITISAIGDCTLGDTAGSELAKGSFHRVYEENGGDLSRPFSGVVDILANDDLTIANLETTLTHAPRSLNRAFSFRGRPEFADMLARGSVELVTMANNHSSDCGPRGVRETQEALSRAGVGYFGLGHVDRRTIRGIEVVNLGYTGGREETASAVQDDVARHKTAKNIVIVSFHWGIEDEHATNTVQHKLGRAAIDSGADLVLGHHPHVLQGIETYRGKKIVYSLGNFVFGGHSQPDTIDSMIYQASFTMTEEGPRRSGDRLIPVLISGNRAQNDFRPIVAEGADRTRILADVERYSAALTAQGRR